MKIAALLLSLVLAGLPLATGQTVEKPMQKAMDSLVLVGCKGPHSEPYVIGSAFPVDDGLLMTARHIDCPDGQQLEVYEGRWRAIDDGDNYGHGYYDVRILVDRLPHTAAHFRSGTVGEVAYSYGAGLGTDGFANIARVMRDEKEYILTSAIPLGGMSGSAIFGEDGAIIGMTVASSTDQRHTATINVGVEGSLLGELLKSFEENVQYK